MSQFDGRVVLITGASSGIGRGTAIEFAKKGARLTITGRNVEKLQQTVELCEKEGVAKENILVQNGDLMDEDFVKLLIDKTMEKFGSLHVLINNAGISKNIKSSQETKLADLDELYKVNVRSVFQLTQLAVPHLIKSKGSIVNVSSIAAVRPLSNAAQSMTKAALSMYTRTLSLELAPQGVRVNAVCPGATKTDIFVTGGYVENEEQKINLYAKMAGGNPLGRIGEKEDVAQAILFLASDAASFITGVELLVDGGRHNTMLKT